MRIQTVESAKLHLYRIYMDDDQFGEIDKTVWEHSRLSVGSDISQDEWEELCERSAIYRAKEKALYYLTSRDYGSAELVQKLVRAGINRMLAEQTVQRLSDNGLIDDARYAAMLARDMQCRKLYSKRRIGMALREKGFSSSVVADVLADLPDEEISQALDLLHRKHVSLPLDTKQRDKILRMLARYGFSYSVSMKAVERLEADDV